MANTVRIDASNLIPENEALRRRLLEMEILNSRSNFELPDELRVLKAENNHFRDLTYSRLAEVEYWKKMYTNERNNYAARIEALKREYEDRFENELKRIKAIENDRTRIDIEVSRQLEEKKIEWDAKYRTAMAEELSRLDKMNSREIEQLKQDLADANTRLRS